jgi:hypothetical protein
MISCLHVLSALGLKSRTDNRFGQGATSVFRANENPSVSTRSSPSALTRDDSMERERVLTTLHHEALADKQALGITII